MLVFHDPIRMHEPASEKDKTTSRIHGYAMEIAPACRQTGTSVGGNLENIPIIGIFEKIF